MEITKVKGCVSILMERLKEVWQPFLQEKEMIQPKELSLEEYLQKAHQDWKEALDYFDNVTEPDLVDHASFLLRAAESKYMYLLKKYKEEGGQK